MTPVERYLAAFKAFSSNGGGQAPEWLRELRANAIERFGTLGFPTTRQEKWRFTKLDALATSEFGTPPPGGSLDPASVEQFMIGEAPSRIAAVTVNGSYVRPSRSPVLPSGTIVTGLAEAISAHPQIVRAHLGKYVPLEDNPFAALSTAFVRDGVFVYVPRGVVVEQPVQIVHITTGTREPVVTHPRTLVVVEPGAQLTLVETFAGDDDTAYWTNPVSEVVVGENAVVDAYRVQRDGARAHHTALGVSHQQRSSVYSLNTFAFGSALMRNDLTAVLDGEGAEATLNGLTLIGGKQHVDYHTTIDHAKPHCNSWELFNGVFDERARGVFNGRIIVRPGAQKTDSKQTNNNLLLSEDARADSQPQLEIYADDVRCTHGATLGPIEPNKMFYLRSRGLNEDQARNLLTYGFSAEILNSVSIEELGAKLDGLVHERLDAAARRRNGS